jgi:hypothetical protein
VLGNVGSLEVARRSYAIAEAYYTAALAILEASVGAEHAEGTRMRPSLAAIYRLTGKPAEAERNFSIVLAAREKELGAPHPDLIPVLEQESAVLRELNRIRDARALEERVQGIRDGQAPAAVPVSQTSPAPPS